jgi:hypothetical protein
VTDTLHDDIRVRGSLHCYRMVNGLAETLQRHDTCYAEYTATGSRMVVVTLKPKETSD